ncbi:MAG: FxsA family protein [Pseudomonas sp.]
MRAFLFLFLLFPIIELAVLIKVGSAIGVLPTLLLVIGSAVLGSVLLRVAGVATAWRARERLSRGELPEQEMLEGLLIAVGGGLLLLPGFISDIFGLLCLLPFTRRLIVGKLRQRAAEQALRQRAFADDLAARSGQTRPNVIEGEFEHRDPQ